MRRHPTHSLHSRPQRTHRPLYPQPHLQNRVICCDAMKRETMCGSAPSVVDGVVYVGSVDDYVYAVSAGR